MDDQLQFIIEKWKCIWYHNERDISYYKETQILILLLFIQNFTHMKIT